MSDLPPLAQDLLERLQRDFLTPGEWLQEFPDDAALLRDLARDSSTFPEVLAALAPYLALVVEVFAPSGLDPVLLVGMASHPDVKVRWKLAECEAAPVEALEILAGPGTSRMWEWQLNLTKPRLERRPDDEDGHALLRCYAREQLRKRAQNPQTAPADLVQLARSLDEYVREDAARNPGLPAEVARELLMDESILVRSAAAEHPQADADLIELLSRAEETTMAVPPEEALPDDPALSSEELESLFAGGPYARMLAAQQLVLSPSELERLWATGDRFLREGIAKNWSRPDTLLEAMARDVTPEVRAEAAREEKLPVDLIVALLSAPHPDVLSGAARNPKARAAADPERFVRHSVAGNPSTPRSLLEQLSNDPDAFVREQAEKRLAELPE